MRWPRTFRIIPSRHPPVPLFERVLDDPRDLDVLAFIEGLTNPRLRDELGDVALVPPAERVLGPGCSPVMATFNHLGTPSRFSDGSFGVYYTARTRDTAVAEVAHHQGRFRARTNEPTGGFDMRVYVARVDKSCHDARGGWPEVHLPDDYGPSQALGRALREAASNGVAYNSVRHTGGQRLAVLRPRALSPYQTSSFTVQSAHLRFRWDGQRVTEYFVYGSLDDAWLPIPA